MNRSIFSSGGLFVIGTDTEVGKTHVACELARLLVQRAVRVGVYKPVASGCVGDEAGQLKTDAWRLREAAGLNCELEHVCPQQFKTAVAPPVAAAQEGRTIDDHLLLTGANWWLGRCDLLIVEGAGGALSPISEGQTVLDLAVQFGYPVLIVAADRLGTVNHTLLTIEAAHKRGLQVVSIVLNRLPADSPKPTEAHYSYELIKRFAPTVPLIRTEQLSEWVLQLTQ